VNSGVFFLIPFIFLEGAGAGDAGDERGHSTSSHLYPHLLNVHLFFPPSKSPEGSIPSPSFQGSVPNEDRSEMVFRALDPIIAKGGGINGSERNRRNALGREEGDAPGSPEPQTPTGSFVV